MIVNDEVELGVDLKRARFEGVGNGTRTASLVPPAPTVRNARLEHERTIVYNVDRQVRGFYWRPTRRAGVWSTWR